MASGLRHSPQTLSRGKMCCSRRVTWKLARESRMADRIPAGPAPMMMIWGITVDGIKPFTPFNTMTA